MMENKSKRILVVDDTDSNRTLLSLLLIQEGYNVVSASSGKEALNACYNNNIDLCILDVKMPGMTGFELAVNLRKDKKTASIPFVFISSNDSKKSMLEGNYLGAIDYIAKPIAPKYFIHKIRAYFHYINSEQQVLLES